MNNLAGRLKKVVILGSGGLRIGQAGEFDYSGSQAIKALKEEGIYTVLINPNIATVQTDGDMADQVYFHPLNEDSVTKILKKEKPDAILLSFGGQTALNLGLSLYEKGILKELGIRTLGTPVSVIKTTEDRELFKKALDKISVKTAQSFAVYNLNEALAAGKKIGYPLMMRSGYSLGGLGSGKISSENELKKRASEVFRAVPQILIEEYLGGWKEVEYEVVRDKDGNTITVCNMENFDPMGIHTGESIVVAPSQTLTNEEYHRLRQIGIKTINQLGIIGECNIQYALNSENGDYRVIEVNARLSRSSALASKATGYPLAFVATKLMLGLRLDEIKNTITNKTPAFFEPALDYLAIKIPRWDLSKLKSSDHSIGTEMKSVGEVMALGRSFPEALQKAIRMLNIGADGLTVHPHTFLDPLTDIAKATDLRLFALNDALDAGVSLEKLHELSKIDYWFLHQILDIKDGERLIRDKELSKENMLKVKKLGFSDKTIGKIKNIQEQEIRKIRLEFRVRPVIKQIDTLAGEFVATTNYLYSTYHGTENDVTPIGKLATAVIGSGPYCIGSSVEFDWCAVNTVKTLKEKGISTIMINSNPETVSTDYDRSDRLYFEELTLERIQDIADFEKPRGLVVSVGGQISNNLALPLYRSGYKILGTSPEKIDQAEDRNKFSSMLNNLGILQPTWTNATSLKSALNFAEKVGFPVLIRPSYVLSGGAMNVVLNKTDLEQYLTAATKLSPDHPTVISQFITNAKELDIDGVARNGELIIYAISEHIENAGVHSGDATIVLPAQHLYLETIRRAKLITKKIVKKLEITGPFNIQFIAKDNELRVIECNVRASRSFPFVSKVTNHNFIDIATKAMLGEVNNTSYRTLEYDYVAVKSPQFSYNRLKGADPIAGVEMASTGEVACFGDNLKESFLTSWLATDQKLNGKRIFISVSDEHKFKLLDSLRNISSKDYILLATTGTYDFLRKNKIQSTRLYKICDKKEPSVYSAILDQKIDLAINIPESKELNQDAYTIRRLAIDNHIPLITNAEVADVLLASLAEKTDLEVKSWQEYINCH